MSLTKKYKSKNIKSISNTKTCKTKGLNIYKITNIFHKDRKCWDCAFGFIIISKNELSARQMIYKEKRNGFDIYGDEEFKLIGKARVNINFWLNPKYSKCELIGKSCLKNEGIVLVDFQDG